MSQEMATAMLQNELDYWQGMVWVMSLSKPEKEQMPVLGKLERATTMEISSMMDMVKLMELEAMMESWRCL